ncbi:hypothetical protein JR316_0004322 [Psilocybe cubensis]|uniref:Uncharacterized protein n=2 Tax=Psilocybe cubensis TaxID=181762 RepID=A0A8H7Y083_PSICU|nr:hypothetical protein JR316_0004322 [Psilocybe cubensis]KAH9482225.1 hypothetical protein JR316_0004322 [Psilocybe cubensis]
MRQLRETLAKTCDEKDAIFRDLLSTRDSQAQVEQLLRDALDDAELKERQMQDLKHQLQQAQEALNRASLDSKTSDALSQLEIKNLQEENELQKADIELLEDENEGLKSVIEDYEKEIKVQQNQIGILYMKATASERDIEALQATIQIKKEFDTRAVQDSFSDGRDSYDTRSGQHPIINPPGTSASPTPTTTSRSSSATAKSEDSTSAHGSVSNSQDGLSPPAESSSGTRTLRRGDAIQYEGFSYPKEHAVPDCVPARKGRHQFSGTGSNAYYTHFSCKHCHFKCKEPKPKSKKGVELLR